VNAAICSQQQNTEMQHDFSQCTGKVTSKYQSSLEKGSNLEEATCSLFENIINECSKILELCHSPDDIGKMKEMQLEALIGQYLDKGDVNLDDCEILNQYWENQDPDDETTDETCSDRMYIQTQTKFQTCSHEISTYVYQTFYEVTDPAVISKSVCEALTNISTSCPDILKECFPADDITQMLAMHLKEIKGYLIKLSNTDVDESSLDASCSVISDLPDINYDEYDDTYYDESADDEETEDSADNSHNVQEILTKHKAEQPADQPGQTDNDQQQQQPDQHDDEQGQQLHDTKEEDKVVPTALPSATSRPSVVVKSPTERSALLGDDGGAKRSGGSKSSTFSASWVLCSMLVLFQLLNKV